MCGRSVLLADISLTALMPSGGRGPREVFDSPWGSRQYRTKSYVREHTETGTP